PMCAFGEQLRSELIEPLLAQLAHYRQLCAIWSHEEDAPRLIDIKHNKMHLEGWLGGLRRSVPSTDSEVASVYTRIELTPGKINKGNQRSWHRLLRPWVQHVLINATGAATQTFIIAQESSISFASLDAERAQQIVQDWLECWYSGLNAPIPVALKTAMAFLKDQADTEKKGKPHNSAQTAYEGGFNTTGEVQQSAALARQYPSYADLLADETFADWTDLLYGALFNAEIIKLERQGDSQ
ncbi:MAG TPA: exodeoxyribonuclease V subunit gamma, partial [Thiopseudomonas sp.]|nr:exodeoxyribonuclease V subunit gamma [Thiopseudomonas sp.]